MPTLPIEPLAARSVHANDPRALLIDVRSRGEFAASHIEGSRNIPLDALDPGALSTEEGAADRQVTLVCESGGRARRAAAILEQAGFARLSVLEGGLKAWRAADLPVAAGAGGVISLERQVRIAAGSLVVLGVLFAWAVSPYAILLSLFVGAGLIFAGVTDTCGMGLLLARAPWNRGGAV